MRDAAVRLLGSDAKHEDGLVLISHRREWHLRHAHACYPAGLNFVLLIGMKRATPSGAIYQDPAIVS